MTSPTAPPAAANIKGVTPSSSGSTAKPGRCASCRCTAERSPSSQAAAKLLRTRKPPKAPATGANREASGA